MWNLKGFIEIFSEIWNLMYRVIFETQSGLLAAILLFLLTTFSLIARICGFGDHDANVS